MKVLLVTAAGIFCVWLFWDSIAVKVPFRTEISVYWLNCDGQKVNGVCRGTEHTADLTTYKVLVKQQDVLYWSGTGPLHHYKNCVVRDLKNWTCQWEGPDKVSMATIRMEDGNLSQPLNSPLIPPSQPFYQVPKWKWWKVWLTEKFN